MHLRSLFLALAAGIATTLIVGAATLGAFAIAVFAVGVLAIAVFAVGITPSASLLVSAIAGVLIAIGTFVWLEKTGERSVHAVTAR